MVKQQPELSENQQPEQQWTVPPADQNDPLLSCLMFLTQFYQRPLSAHALTAGMPLENNRLTPELFQRAAERAKLTSKIAKKDLFSIHDQTLPVILLLADQRACILLEWLEDGLARVVIPESGIGETLVEVAELEELYFGHCIFIKPKYNFSDRAHETLEDDKSKHWFWSTIRQAWPTYSEVLVASFLINLFALASPLFIMNVYDRVVPNNAVDTLWVLAIGVGAVFTFDFIMKTLRGYFVDVAGKSVDIKLSAKIFEHMLGIRMANRPRSVGAFANTVHSFEAFREFITSTTITVLIDLPFVVLYLTVIY